MTKITTWLKNAFGPRHARPGEPPENEAEHAEVAPKTSGFKIMRFQHTPNPEAGQFIISAAVVKPGGTRTFASADDTKGDAFAEALFKIFGVENVFLKENFVTITKGATVGWTALMDPVQQAVETHLKFYDVSDEDAVPKPKETANILEEVDVEDFPNFSDEQKSKIIDAVLDHAIRPALANDGGGITLVDVQGNLVRVHYQGACGTCPSSTTGTLQYIETFLKDTLHADLKVETVDAAAH